MITLTTEQYQKLVNGRFKSFKCTQCDGKGWYWVHGDGTRCDPNSLESHDGLYRHRCDFDDCDGVGFRVVYGK